MDFCSDCRLFKALMRTVGLSIAVGLSLCGAAGAETRTTSLPRLGVRQDKDGRGEFYNTATGEAVLWRGTNHCRFITYPGDKTFAELYDRDDVETMFRKMRAAGYNVVRVFLRKGNITATDGSATLNEAYMANVVDFIRRGASHGVYTYLTCDWVPDAYVAAVGELPESTPKIQGTNNHYFSERFIRAYGHYWGDVLRRVKAEDRALLTAIAGIDLKNEICFGWSDPFDRREGTLTVPGVGTFDLASAEERRQLANAVAVRWVREIRVMVKAVDPDALVSVSAFFVRDADALPVEPPIRHAALPKHIAFGLAAIQDMCDFLDTHFYVAPWNQPYTSYQDWEGNKHASRLRLDKPMVIGEIGVFRNAVDYDLARGMSLLADFQAETYQHLNARGWLHWLWDARGFEEFWSDQWLIERNPPNWMGPTGRPDPAAPPLAYEPIPERPPDPLPDPLGPPERFHTSEGATLTATPYGYLLTAPEPGTSSARRMLDTPGVKRLDLEAAIHYDRAKHRCATLRFGDSVANRWVELEMIWDGARCRLKGDAVAPREVPVRRPPIAYDGHMFSSWIAVSADLAEKQVTLTFNGNETVTEDLLELKRIDAIEIVRNHDAQSHVAITTATVDTLPLRLAGVFSDHAVLQRDRPVPVWGWATPGAEITVEFAGQSKAVTVAAAGKWQVTLDPMPASSEPRTLVAATRNPHLESRVSDLLVGDVWLCSGQSNMALALAVCARTHPPLKQRLDEADNPLLRLGSVPATWPGEPLTDVACTWRAAAPESAYGFSAIGYLFGDRIQREVGVPVGVINASRGGTWIENWLPQESVETLPSCERYITEYRKALAEYPDAKARYDKELADFNRRFPTQRALAAENAARKQRGEKPLGAPRKPRGPEDYNRPGSLFNGLIAPLVPFAIKGVLWYQGEGNVWEFSIYDQKVCELIRSWRGLFSQPDLPFFMSELAPLGEHSPLPQDSARSRFGVALAKAAAEAGNAWTITITDGGEQKDIHPRYKEIPAERFAAMALAKVYGKPGVCHGPVLGSWRMEDEKAILTFVSVGAGLMVRDVTLDGHDLSVEELVGFELADKNRRFFRAKAEIKGIDTVLVSCPEVPEPAAVRYAWGNFPLCNLYNKQGFATYPFRTDDWPWMTPSAE
ncbi:MAG: cellulase family glycosylhydrolase [Lentisphaerae bacterium]|jgi:sialate O-acetylesterase|nr:cellulase family glycosylhydrolase [Lentisphaerota bacterium]MBT5608627.1 cellulase family glycosylhydrolase [Lentisphaerota bacterium]MBT7055858.1 cellulase family glycosylhydrolase [Lentisphaerota bacterium]MBT7841742.1 cellulase family glycosylhydrolase [Lentisphaerota bacterium]